MPWQQLKISVSEADAALVEDTLDECGAVSVTMMDSEDQPVFQVELGSTPIWQNTEVLGAVPPRRRNGKHRRTTS